MARLADTVTEFRTDLWQRAENFLTAYGTRKLGPITMKAIALVRELHESRVTALAIAKKVDRENKALKAENAALLKRKP